MDIYHFPRQSAYFRFRVILGEGYYLAVEAGDILYCSLILFSLTGIGVTVCQALLLKNMEKHRESLTHKGIHIFIYIYNIIQEFL